MSAAAVLPLRAYAVSLAALLAGASAVHALYAPSLKLPPAADAEQGRSDG